MLELDDIWRKAKEQNLVLLVELISEHREEPT